MASIYGIQILQNLISAGGAYDAPPDPIVGWGGGYPSPLTTPSTLSSFCSRSLGSVPAAARNRHRRWTRKPNFWIRPCGGYTQSILFCVYAETFSVTYDFSFFSSHLGSERSIVHTISTPSAVPAADQSIESLQIVFLDVRSCSRKDLNELCHPRSGKQSHALYTSR